jgi:hypothetical protein
MKCEIMKRTVFPAPLGPTIRVKGLKKVMTFLFSGSKLRMPLISILSTVLIVASFSLFRYYSFICCIHSASSSTRAQYSTRVVCLYMLLPALIHN